MKFGLSGIIYSYSKNSQKSKKVIGIIGHWSHSFGIGSATREMAKRIEGNRFEVKKYDFEYFKEIVKTTNDKVFKRFIGDHVLLISALPAVHSMKLPQFEDHEKNPNYITYWWWETEEIPEYFLRKAEFFDQIWAPTTFIFNNLQRVFGNKVVQAPLLFSPNEETEEFVRTDFQLPENLPVFLVKFDFYSSVDRKNPYAAIEAYKKAFKSDSEAYLLIKTINGESNSHLLDELILSVEDRQDIRVWDKNLSNALNNDLMKCVSAYVSLHRSEGLGLNILEAMQVKVPVIVTAYGGNMDFCNYVNSFLIPFELVPVEDRSYLYPPLGCWAEADVDAAALAMTSIAQSEEVVETKKEEAFITVENLNRNNKFPLFIEKILADLTLKNKQDQVDKSSREYLLKKLSKIQKNLAVKSRDYLKLK